MEFHTNPPPSLGPYQYEATAIITLDPISHAGEDDNLLTRTLSAGRRGSVGSQGRRSSFNGPKEGVHDPEHGGGLRRIASGGRRKSMDAAAAKAEMLRDPNAPPPPAPAPANPELGGGLRKVLSGGRRKSMDAAAAKAEMLRDPNAPPAAPHATSAVTDSPPTSPISRPARPEAKGGKWAAKVITAVTPTHLVIVIPNDTLLAPYSSATHSIITGEPASASIGDKIKGFLRRGSKTDVDESTPHDHKPHVPVAYPSYINGDAVTHILVPIGDVIEDGVKLVDDKNQIGVRVKISARLATLVHPILDSIGGQIDESWGRSGSIKFSFNRQWIGAKAEAEVFHHAILTSMEHKLHGTSAEHTAEHALGAAQHHLVNEPGARRASAVTEASGAKVQG